MKSLRNVLFSTAHGWLLAGAALVLFFHGLAAAEVESEFRRKTRQRLELAVRQARIDLDARPGDFDSAVKFARLSFELGEFATNSAQRAQIAEAGIAVATAAIHSVSNRVEGHYFLGLNLGQLARTKSLGALKLVAQMEKAFKMAISLDPKYDRAGGDRCLGLLYLQAPGWPTSVGNRNKASLHLHKAYELFPDDPENILNLIEAHAEWGDRKEFSKYAEGLGARLSKLKSRFEGQEWEDDWEDWNRRASLLKPKADKWGVKIQ